MRRSAIARGLMPRRAQRRVRGFFWPNRIFILKPDFYGYLRVELCRDRAHTLGKVFLNSSIRAGSCPRWRLCVDLRQLILTRWNIAYHERTIGKLLRRLGFRHISARPRHLGQDPARIEEFKKTLPSV